MLKDNGLEHLENIIKCLYGYSVEIIGANSDPGGRKINGRLMKFTTGSMKRIFHQTLRRDDFLQILNTCKVIIGNSSCGILESPSLGVWTINVGPRQEGRIQAESVINCEDGNIKEALEPCTLCYSCRQACPVCYCNLCFVDQNLPVWFGKTTQLPDVIVFHLIRAFHLAGRCVACGACSSVCPVGIDLNKITRKLEEIVKKRYNFTSGLSAEKVPPMMDFSMKDAEEFMLEED